MSKNSKALRMLLLFGIVFSVFSIVLLISMAGGSNLSILNTIPLTGAPQMVLLFALVILGAFGGAFLGSFLAKSFLILHKKFVGKKLNYNLQEIDVQKAEIKTISALYPTLFGISVAISLASNSTVQSFILPPAVSVDNLTPGFKTFVGLLPLTIFLGMLIFVPFWLVLKSGIVFSNEQKVEGKAEPVEVMSMGRWYLYLLKGYAGIGAISGFYLFLSESLVDLFNAAPQYFMANVISLILFLLMPFILMVFCIPGLLLYEKMQNGKINSLQKTAKKLGIIEGPKPIS